MEIDSVYEQAVSQNVINPLMAYKNESSNMFDHLLETITKRARSSLVGLDPETVTIQAVETYSKRFIKFFKERIFPCQPNEKPSIDRTISPDGFNFDVLMADLPKCHTIHIDLNMSPDQRLTS
uniref:Uncharacterized protein n=1 Tax=Ditylenchus dipsaci TaxID=166011 RepID=A0A915CSR4_9BILA